MKFLSAVHTDTGIKKETNQDAVLLHEAVMGSTPVLFAVICDGMGGLAKGEVASASVVQAFDYWFRQVFPFLFRDGGLEENDLRRSWEQTIFTINDRIQEYGQVLETHIGTTLVALLIVGDSYYIVNVGDSRVYRVADALEQLTKYQTLVQREVDLGQMTVEQARQDPQRNVLLQCIGVTSTIVPDFSFGKAQKDAVYFLCSDGFRNVVEPGEFFERLHPQVLTTQQTIMDSIVYLTELNKYRQENDNISVIAIRTY